MMMMMVEEARAQASRCCSRAETVTLGREEEDARLCLLSLSSLSLASFFLIECKRVAFKALGTREEREGEMCLFLLLSLFSLGKVFFFALSDDARP